MVGRQQLNIRGLTTSIFIVVGLLAAVISMPFLLSLSRGLAFGVSRAMATQVANVTPYSMAFVTVPNEEVAKTLARGIVEKKLAACVNIIPKIISVYEWEGKINEDDELLLMIKTRSSVIQQLTTFVRENHPYSVCEVISTSIEQGNQAYLDWIGSVVPEK